MTDESLSQLSYTLMFSYQKKFKIGQHLNKLVISETILGIQLFATTHLLWLFT